MGSQSQAQAPQQAHARPLANHAAAAQPTNMSSSSNGNGLAAGGGSIPRISSLARQTSIYSVTLDELQRSVMNPESGQMLGSMNMDDFMKSVWSFSENQAMAQGIGEGSGGRDEQGGGGGGDESMASENGGLARQHSFIRQPSLPRTMSNKTVEEVWQAIVREHPNLENDTDTAGDANNAGRGLSTSDGRRTTLGEMTIEAFLMKAGLSVKEDSGLSGQPSTPFSLFSPFSSGGTNGNAGPSDRGNERERMGPGSFAATLSLSPANGLGSQAEMESYKQQQGQAQAQVQAQAQAQAADKQVQQQQDQIDWFRNMQQQQAHQQQQQQLYQQQAQAQADVYAMQRKVANGGMLPNMGQNGGYTGIASALAPGLSPLGMAQLGGGMALGLPQSSPSHSPASDGVGQSHGNGLSLSPVGNYGVMRGRKRGMEGPVEKNVERRQRRMIKNRESAARSRARKQAYTVELEAEVTQLKEENKRLRREKVPNPHHYLNHFLASLKQSFPLDETEVRNRKLVLDGIREAGRKTLRRTKTGPW